MTELILSQYGLQNNLSSIKEYGSGLINSTSRVSAAGNEYILQKINNTVFKQPYDIADNISLIANFLKQNYPQYPFVAPITAIDGKEMIYIDGSGYFRLFPFVKGSCSFEIANTPGLAFEAALQFGRFTKLLSQINSNDLKITIPCFHDLGFRYQQFTEALASADNERKSKSEDSIKTLKNNYAIADEYKKIQINPAFKKRVTHHDTKISNVLFDCNKKGICVIDLDTVMPGYFISDVGDMMRTYLSPVSEEEADFSKISIRRDYYKAIVEGYASEMKDELSQVEKQYFFYAGKFSIYMQALRFLTDYLNDDAYYGSAYPGQNLIRASNQIVLLEKFIEARPELIDIGINS